MITEEIYRRVKVGIGQDSHRFDFEDGSKKLILGGVILENCTPLKGNSDADVVLHSITNAISSVTCVNIIGKVADKMCLQNGIKDSSAYLKEALKYLNSGEILHVSIAIECAKPIITPKMPDMRKNISLLLDISEKDIGITATTGEGLTEFGKGIGIQCFSCVTVLI